MIANVCLLLISLINLLSDKTFSPNMYTFMYTSLDVLSPGRQALKRPYILALTSLMSGESEI